MKYLFVRSTTPSIMGNTFLLLIVTLICFSGCDTADNTDHPIHSATDSIQKDTSTTIVETKTIASSDTTLEDGWHTVDHSNMGVNRNFYGYQLLNLHQQAFISFADIIDIQSEMFIDGIDTARVITFDLTQHGKAAQENMIRDTKNNQIYFILDNKLINLVNVYTNPEKTRTHHFELFLGYSDFTAQEALDIETRIREKI